MGDNRYGPAMALRDEIQELLDNSITTTPLGKLIAEEGEDAALRADPSVPEMLAVVAAIFGAHRDAIMRLADEIDALRP